jgi:hypothetical protein
MTHPAYVHSDTEWWKVTEIYSRNLINEILFNLATVAVCQKSGGNHARMHTQCTAKGSLSLAVF